MENANVNLKKVDTYIQKDYTLPVNKDKNAAAVFPKSIEYFSKLERKT